MHVRVKILGGSGNSQNQIWCLEIRGFPVRKSGFRPKNRFFYLKNWQIAQKH